MKFTYDAYKRLLELLQENGYALTDYHKYTQYEKCCILRHDVDMSLEKAVKLAELENEWGGGKSYLLFAA